MFSRPHSLAAMIRRLKKKLRIAVNGACGRMGLTVGRLALEDPAFVIAAAIESKNSPHVDRDYGTLLGGGPIGVPVTTSLDRKVDALIDFSNPEATLQRLRECVRLRVPTVLCTTGLHEADLKAIRAACRRIACVMSSNMSIGMNVLFRTVPEIARLLGNDYDIEIVEMHHRFKKDAPSGTAMTLASKIAESLGRKAPEDLVFGRKGLSQGRRRSEIGVHALRAGDVVGEHRILFASLGDSIEIIHRASSRDIFARGALRAVTFVSGAPAGLYSLHEVIR